ncbi:hypothetical protein [Photobacterium damselae]|uniref:hypothetical protein n=1 Tax=Photobacterium damselae TaxID=38293 RepID=UPI002543545B
MNFESLTKFSDYEINRLQRDIWNTPVVYEWNATGWTVTELGVFLFALIASLFMPLTFAFFSGNYSMDLFLFWVLLFVMAYVMYRFLFIPKELNHYQLTSIGIRYSSQKEIPDFVYTGVRYIAWGGAILSIIGVAIMGPFALIGAGGFAMLAVGFVNYKPKNETYQFFFLETVNIRFYRKKNIVKIYTDDFDVYCIGRVYLNKNNYDFFKVLSKQVTIKSYTEVDSMRKL